MTYRQWGGLTQDDPQTAEQTDTMTQRQQGGLTR